MLENHFFGLNTLPKHDGLEILYDGPGIDPLFLPQIGDLQAKKVPEVVRWISFHPCKVPYE